MNRTVSQKIINICNNKIAKQGGGVGLSFYAFFTNKNDNPELLFEVAKWWIMRHKLNHFEKAIDIRKLVENELD